MPETSDVFKKNHHLQNPQQGYHRRDGPGVSCWQGVSVPNGKSLSNNHTTPSKRVIKMGSEKGWRIRILLHCLISSTKPMYDFAQAAVRTE